MTKNIMRALAPVTLALILAGCGGTGSGGEAGEKAGAEKAEGAEASEAKEGPKDAVILSAQQIADAGIEVTRPTVGGEAGAIELSATIEGDPQGVQVVSASVGGRLVSLTRNLGQPVGRGDPLAVIESREAASLKAEVEAARARAALAQTNLRREQRLFAERVSPEQDLVAARTAATEASIALRLAQQQLSATGSGGGALNRIAVRSPIAGQVIARSATLGQTVAADAELFRVANLSKVTVATSLVPTDAGRVKPGARVEVTAAGRRQEGRVTFVSPILDETTRLVPVIVTLDNGGSTWRVGETVNVSILVPATGDRTVAVPSAAVQMIEDKSFVFVRTPTGFRATPVTLGRTNGGQVVVTSGLTGSERIASTNSFTLKAELGKGDGGDED
ncbi:efflux RND transporter periplasmic adaptor subunit [Sphingomonas sp. RHCKR47]|jgi:cobalt-zinc-cadmium efflux system membrane fusion protein|uniref:Cobalt-zinc-cadmium resistance protein CzcB n=3 Tax=Sphingomonas TaxID=13687 RepID=A0A245ZDA8_9SPHN|nr:MULTISPECIES: efflux RND transporter periplasmic adaptor subunit [Sphingomonas]MDJ7775475.1 efflux RND transporter periplasmic adaptor subunit [Salmonella enterica]PXA98570.1 efflux RND transporter periplasmic adaptor subunit [Nostoc sp. 3335mG]MBW6525215.1 efflux RND transporter periplasmic adaptor subunit [Sphingomonas citricola]MDP1028745.1 efflux RND transporter periplasmic adaptor subunit [Sphingomonas sp. KR1UV-12]OWK27671.1 cobalt-zinc-cadmium resistance protein CzcB [Sphingomonas do